MYIVKVKHISQVGGETTDKLLVDIRRPVDAWRIAKSLAHSYQEHGLDKTGKSYWFKDRSGLHYIWAEEQKSLAA